MSAANALGFQQGQNSNMFGTDFYSGNSSAQNVSPPAISLLGVAGMHHLNKQPAMNLLAPHTPMASSDAIIRAIGSASQEELLQARNQAYASLREEVIACKTEVKTLREMIALLAAGKPTASVTASEPIADDSTKPRKEDNPQIVYWEKKKYDDKLKEKGVTDVNADSTTGILGFVQNIDGTFITKEQTAIIRKWFRHCFRWLAKRGDAPRTWGKIDVDVLILFFKQIYQMHPELEYCQGNWKAIKIATEAYPSWYRNVNWSDIEAYSVKQEELDELEYAEREQSNEPSSSSNTQPPKSVPSNVPSKRSFSPSLLPDKRKTQKSLKRRRKEESVPISRGNAIARSGASNVPSPNNALVGSSNEDRPSPPPSLRPAGAQYGATASTPSPDFANAPSGVVPSNEHRPSPPPSLQPAGAQYGAGASTPSPDFANAPSGVVPLNEDRSSPPHPLGAPASTITSNLNTTSPKAPTFSQDVDTMDLDALDSDNDEQNSELRFTQPSPYTLSVDKGGDRSTSTGVAGMQLSGITVRNPFAAADAALNSTKAKSNRQLAIEAKSVPARATRRTTGTAAATAAKDTASIAKPTDSSEKENNQDAAAASSGGSNKKLKKGNSVMRPSPTSLTARNIFALEFCAGRKVLTGEFEDAWNNLDAAKKQEYEQQSMKAKEAKRLGANN
ncbi:hypothetical protein SCHPADRAFT_942301 [Schizopora paradoxa]|uniref:Uncharacterized protein n=1 Tax=Schizopora paradoxa TaxID=27342 RepID=A0A0H2S2D6_9AGAM|nr:hypothetical protein SCHPADRAFT_942301 [Schizopora paradoxa]